MCTKLPPRMVGDTDLSAKIGDSGVVKKSPETSTMPIAWFFNTHHGQIIGRCTRRTQLPKKKSVKSTINFNECLTSIKFHGIMRYVIKDKPTPKTGGVSSHAHATATSRFELGSSNFGLVSDFEIPISHFPRPVGAKYAKRTQSATSTTKKYETNPISSRRHPKNAKRTQSTSTPACLTTRNMPNEPNLPHLHRPTDPKNTKRTQSTSTPACPTTQKMRNEPNLHRDGPVEDEICETNPISAAPDEILRTKDYMLKTAFYKTNPITVTLRGTTCP